MIEESRKVKPGVSGDTDRRFRKLMETTGIIPWEADARTWKFSYVGPQAEEILGYPVEKWYEEEFWVRTIHPEDRARAGEFCAKSCKTSSDFEFEYRMLAADGSVRWIHDIVHVDYAGDDPATLRGFMIDVSDRKRAEADRNLEEERLRAVAHSTADLIYDFDALSGNTNWIGDIDAHLGYEPGEFPRTFEGWKEKIHPDDYDDVLGKVEYFLEIGGPVYFEYRIRCKDGSYRNWEVRGSVIQYEGNRPVRFVGACSDVTDRKRAEQDLRLRLSALESVHDGILIVDAQDPGLPVIYASPSFSRLTGYSREEVLGSSCRLLQGPETDEAEKARIFETFQKGVPFEGEILNYRKDGTAFWNLLRILPVRDATGVVTHFVGTQNDVTQRKESEEAIKSLGARLIRAQEEERRRIARELHDDLNQRLALLAIELEEFGQKPPKEAREIRKRMKQLWERTRELSADVHRLSYQLHPSKLEQLGLVPGLRSFCRDVEKQEKIKVRFEASGVSRTLPADVTLVIYRVAQEAVHNAVRHSGARRVEVKVSGAKGGIRLKVSDSGRGFSPSSANRGLGLLSMDERLRTVGGTLKVESRPKKGTRIEARVPLEK